jgi:hypothetical protein
MSKYFKVVLPISITKNPVRYKKELSVKTLNPVQFMDFLKPGFKLEEVSNTRV